MTKVLPTDNNNVLYEGVRDASGAQFVSKEGYGTVTTDSDGVKSQAQAVGIVNANPNGQAAMANSSPVVIASDQIVPVQGGTKEIIGQGPATVNAINTDLIPQTDVSAYKWLSLHITGTYSATLAFQGSNDGINWTNIQLVLASGVSGINVLTNTGGTNQVWMGPVNTKYIRVRATSFTSNTSLGAVLELYSVPPPLMLNNVFVNLQAATQGGASDFHLVSVASTNANTIKASAGQVYGYDITNTNVAWRYVKLFNKAANPTLGTDTPTRTIGIPPNGHATYANPLGIAFGTGIALATTTGSSDADATAVGAGDLIIEIDWK